MVQNPSSCSSTPSPEVDKALESSESSSTYSILGRSTTWPRVVLCKAFNSSKTSETFVLFAAEEMGPSVGFWKRWVSSARVGVAKITVAVDRRWLNTFPLSRKSLLRLLTTTRTHHLSSVLLPTIISARLSVYMPQKLSSWAFRVARMARLTDRPIPRWVDTTQTNHVNLHR